MPNALAPLAYVQYQGDGTTRTFAVPFPYLAKEHITVLVDGVNTSFVWLDDNNLQTTVAPAAGSVVDVRRSTPNDQRMVTFKDGSTVLASNENLSATQLFYIVQEAFDFAAGTLAILPSGAYGANGRRISQLGDPIDPQDAVTKQWAQSGMSSQLVQAESYKNAAQTAKGQAEDARDEAKAARNTAQAARDKAQAWASQLSIPVEGDKYSAKWNADVATTAREKAEQWAVKVDGPVSGGEYSAKWNANRAEDARTRAQEWANKTDGVVSGGEYSAKKYAQDAEAARSEAQEWASKTGGVVKGGEYSAKKYAQDAANEAQAASQSADDAQGYANMLAQAVLPITPVVLDDTLTAPPSAPAQGDQYIVPGGASGAWVNQTHRIARYEDGAWEFFTPAPGWSVFLRRTNRIVWFTGSAWAPLDVERLNGQTAAFYRNAGNLNAGTVAKARLSGEYNISLEGTYTGRIGNLPNTVLNNAEDWSNLPVGASRFISNNSALAPVNAYGYFHKIANRDSSSGWAGLWVSHGGNNQAFLGKSATGNESPTWMRLWSDKDQGHGSGLDADKLDGKEGTYYDDIANGRRITFYEASAPTGYVQETGLNDRVLRVVNGAGAGTGGSWTISGLSASTSVSVAGHVLTVAQMPKHRHGITVSGGGNYGFSEAVAGRNSVAGVSTNQIKYEGGNAAHSHGASASTSVSQNGTWRPSYVNIIICRRSK